MSTHIESSGAHCDACAAPLRFWLAMPIDAKKQEPTPFGRILRCDRCGLARSADMPEPAEVGAFYDLAAYYTHGESHMTPVAPNLADRILTRLAWTVDRARPFDVDAIAATLKPGASILDIGCGDGEKLAAFRRHGFTVLGVDPDPGSRAFVASQGLLALDGTAEAPPAELAGHRFDLVIMSHALEHCIDPARALATMRDLMAPDGIGYVEVPNAAALHFERFRQCSEMFDAPRHLWFFTPDALSRMAAAAGLGISDWHYNGFTRLFSPTWRGWECQIHDRLAERGAAAGLRRHSRWESALLLARSALAPPARKYDSFGILVSRTPNDREHQVEQPVR